MSVSNPPPSGHGTPANSPQLSPHARDHALALARTFQIDLVTVSQTIARHGGFNFIDVPHVDGAMESMRRAGLRRVSCFLFRPDFRVGVGGILLGFGPTVASISKDVIESWGKLSDNPIHMWVFMIGIPFAICLGGGILAVWGWVQSDRGG